MVDRTTNGARLGAGDVTIELDGKSEVLKCTLFAAQSLSRQNGGLITLMKKVGDVDFDAIVSVVAAGLGYGLGGQSKVPDSLAERVYKTGLSSDTGGLAERCVAYLANLSRGGRPRRAAPKARAREQRSTLRRPDTVRRAAGSVRPNRSRLVGMVRGADPVLRYERHNHLL